MAQYKIIHAPSKEIAKFEALVTQALEQGWLCVGGVAIMTTLDGQVHLVQALMHPDTE
jgi:hypothetical protein